VHAETDLTATPLEFVDRWERREWHIADLDFAANQARWDAAIHRTSSGKPRRHVAWRTLVEGRQDMGVLAEWSPSTVAVEST
jgi:hypothetical protein